LRSDKIISEKQQDTERARVLEDLSRQQEITIKAFIAENQSGTNWLALN